MSRAARELVRKNPGLAPGLALVAVLAIWSHRDGGYAVVDWAPGAIFVLALALIVLLLAPGSFGRTVPLVVTTSFLAAFTLWSYLTIGWAEVQANAWTGANRTLLYLVVFVLMTARPWSSAGASVFLGAYAMGVWAVSMVAFGRAVDLTDVSLAFREGRLAVPISYSNASCALFISAALPALHLAARREVPAVLRGAFLAAAGTLVELVLLTQSRASLVILPVMAVLWVLLVPGRVRSVVALFTVTAVVGVSAPWHLDVYRAVLSETDAGSVLERSLVVVASSAIVLFALGTVWGWLDSRIEVSPRVTRVSGRALTGLTASVVVIAVAVAAASVSNPGARASAAWDHFRNEQYVSDAETPHLASGFGSGRWKIWTVAVDQFAESPVIGAGGDNFGVDYLRERQDQAQPLHPHSIELRTLSQTGIVGSLLLLGFLASAAWAVLSNARGATPYTRGLVGISGLVFCYWLIHGSIDWFWEIPALAAPAFALLGLAMRVRDRVPEPRPRSLRAPVVLACGAAVLLPVASLFFPWLAARETKVAISEWHADPAGAFDRLERARAINPLSDEPDVVAAIIASELGDEKRQEEALHKALERNPTNWYPMVELAALETRRSHSRKAFAWLDRAEKLNPREPTIAFIRQQIGLGRAVSSEMLQRMWVDQASLLTGQRQQW